MREKMMRRARGVVAATGVLVAVAALPAHAASGTWSSGGVTGVHAQGSWKTQYSKLYFSGYVKDTACDGHNVKLKITFVDVTYKVPVPYRDETKYNTSGCGSSALFSYNTYVPGHKISVQVKECVVDGGKLGADLCGPTATVLTTTP